MKMSWAKNVPESKFCCPHFAQGFAACVHVVRAGVSHAPGRLIVMLTVGVMIKTTDIQ